MGMEGNLGQLNNERIPQSDIEVGEKRERLTVDEIRGQLEYREYEIALQKFKEGDRSDEEYLIVYQGNLFDWMNDILGGKLQSGDEKVLAEVKRRLDAVSSVLEGAENILQ